MAKVCDILLTVEWNYNGKVLTIIEWQPVVNNGRKGTMKLEFGGDFEYFGVGK